MIYLHNVMIIATKRLSLQRIIKTTKTMNQNENRSETQKGFTYRDRILISTTCFFQTVDGRVFVNVGNFLTDFFCAESIDKAENLSNICVDCFHDLKRKLQNNKECVIDETDCAFVPVETFYNVACEFKDHTICSDFWNVVDEMKKVAKVVELKDFEQKITK